eukprot:m.61985 g.61985  ORF g.61985 m.61985 type:complete len:169 (-) comp11471_c0_seq6:26-532(-)
MFNYFSNNLPVSSVPPFEVSKEIPNARLQGKAKLRYFGIHVYDIRLWSNTAVTQTNIDKVPLALELQYALPLAGRRIADRGLSEMQRVGILSNEKKEKWLQLMQQAFPDVQTGDRITGIHKGNSTTVFYHNGSKTQEVKELEFAKRFFGIWLGSWSSDPYSRDALLQG